MFFSQAGKDSKLSDLINQQARMMGFFYKRQSDRTLPRTSFNKGIKKGKLMAHEMTGLILILLSVLRSKQGRETLMTKSLRNQVHYFRNEKKIDAWIRLLETMLQMEEWLKLKDISAFEIRRAKTKFQEVMQMWNTVGQKDEGMGC